MNSNNETIRESNKKSAVNQQVNNDEMSMAEITKFYSKAFEPLPAEQEGKIRVYRVFIGRRSFVQACSYVREHLDALGDSIVSTVYSDGGLRILAAGIAEDFYYALNNNDEKALFRWQSQHIILFDDILIYGRALGGLLSAAEEIFADRYLELSGGKGDREQLYNCFLQFVSINTALKNSQSNLLRNRYRNRLAQGVGKECQPEVWRRISYEIAADIYHSDFPNAAFIPAICFEKGSNYSELIRNSFLQIQNEGSFQHFSYTFNQYNNRKLDTYISCVSRDDTLKALLTLRSTKDYIIPFIFLPNLSESSFSMLEQSIVYRLNRVLPEAGTIVKRKAEQWKRTKKLDVMYIELINMILSVSLLRAFLCEINLENTLLSDEDYQSFLYRNTTYQIMMCNYAHDEDIAILLRTLFDLNIPPCLSLEEISVLILDSLQQDEFIIHNEMIETTRKNKGVVDIYRVETKLEKVIFTYGIESERNAFDLLTGSVSPSYDSIQYFSFPMNNTLSSALHDIYSNRISWLHEKASVYDIVAYLLQMMDAGCFSLTVGESSDNCIIQCLKTGEQSLNTVTYHFAMFLPLLHEIVQRCHRQNIYSTKAFYNEFVTFLNKYPNCDKLDDIDKKIISLYKEKKNQLYDLVTKIIGAGQSCSDYFFLTERKLKEFPTDLKPKAYYDYCSYLYHAVMY